MTTTRRPSLLMVVAHPDDEIFHGGVLAHLSRRGTRVQLLSLTHGEAGKVRDPSHQVSDLAALRAEELRLSCARLGIEEPRILDFHDSGRGQSLRVDDARALVNVDTLEVEAAIRAAIVDAKPQVIVTHDPHGGYAHPDHIVTCRAVTGAFYSSGVMGGDAPERLLYTAIERETFRVFADVSRGKGPGGGLDPDVFGTAEPMIALSFDARPYMELKLAAMAAHRSQFGLTVETVHNPPPHAAEMMGAIRPVLERESFTLGAVRGRITRWPLADFFEGLETAGLLAEVEEPIART
jgi:N-acetyl-1-D-myo-inositol-2-amino-2-deoxy-alpha-D-glucopyranoside deacetylase